MRLAEGVGAQPLARGQAGQVLLALLGVAPASEAWPTSELCTETTVPRRAATLFISSSMRMYDSVSAPTPPYSSGTSMPAKPSSPICLNTSRGKCSLSSHSCGVRLQLARGEVAGEVADLLLFVGQVEVHGASRCRICGACNAITPELCALAMTCYAQNDKLSAHLLQHAGGSRFRRGGPRP